MSLPDAFTTQAQACRGLGSDFMGRLCELLAGCWPPDTAFGRLCLEWPGDLGPGGASLPLRIAGGLHALVLLGRDEQLQAVYPPHGPASDEALCHAVLAALEKHEAFLTDWLQSAPQTNEVRRSVALIGAGHWLADRLQLPFVTSELGASGGLNLNWDRYALQARGARFGPDDPVLTLRPDWQGDLPPRSRPVIRDRAGVDLNPLDLHDPDQVLRLQAYLWPDQPERMALTRAAINALSTKVEKADAIDWLETRLNTPSRGAVHLIYHTVAWQYFPADAQARGTALIEAAGGRASPDAPLAWFGMENDGDAAGAGLTLRLWPGNQTFRLGRCDFHGRWIEWRPEQIPNVRR